MKRTSMKKIKETIRLGTGTDLSLRQIACAVRISRPVVTKYLTAFKSSGLTYDEIKEMNDNQIYALFFGNRYKWQDSNERYAILSSKFEYISHELTRRHVTLQKLWEEYIEQYPDGYSRSQFCEHFNRWRKSTELSMHLEHKAGDKMFVDFTGKKFYLTDKETGKLKAVETFVAILPCSQYTYVCATETQKTPDWIKGSQLAFRFFGGTTTAITPDCFKSAVTKHNRYDPDINPEYSRFAEHYDTVILPARPLHPKDKALVENSVKIVYSRIYASLRNRTFYTLSELNRAISEELVKYNDRKMQVSQTSRRELFEQHEQESLRSLPVTLYEHKTCCKATIQSNYHVLLSKDKRYYSVPYQYYSESVSGGRKKVKAELFYSRDSVEIYFKGERIAVHKRSHSQKYTTNPDHMPEKHRRYLERWNPEKIIALAKTKGPFVAELVEKLVSGHKHPEQSYKTCQGIIFLSRTYGCDRLDSACHKALHLEFCSYKAVRDMLKHNREEMDTEPDLSQGLVPDHGNIRGKEYFKTKLRELLE
jgi:transposase